MLSLVRTIVVSAVFLLGLGFLLPWFYIERPDLRVLAALTPNKTVQTIVCSSGLIWKLNTHDKFIRGSLSLEGIGFHSGLLRKEPDLVLLSRDHELFREGGANLLAYRANDPFPTGAAIISAYLFHKEVIGNGSDQYLAWVPIQINATSGISSDHFVAAATCLNGSRESIERILTSLGPPVSKSGYADATLPDRINVKLGWMVLIDDSVDKPKSDTVWHLNAVQGQVFACDNDYVLETVEDRLVSRKQVDKPAVGAKLLGFIRPDGRLVGDASFNGSSTGYNEMMPLDINILPSAPSACRNSKGVSLEAFLNGLSARIIYSQ